MTRRADEMKAVVRNLTPLTVFDYYDGPRFYSCVDVLGQLYLVFWIDETSAGLSWLYLRVSPERYAAVVRGAVPIAFALSQPEDGHAFVVEGGRDNLLVMEIDLTEIQPSWLPAPTDRLALDVPTLPVKTSSAVELAARAQRQVLDLAFTKISNTYEFSARKLGRLLESFQSTVEALACGADSSVRRVPDEVKDRSELLVTGVFASSFGVRLQTKGSDIFASDETAGAFETLGKLINALDAPHSIATELHKFNILARSRFKHLLVLLIDAQISLTADWGNPDGRSIQARASFEQIFQALGKLKEVDETTKRIVERRGSLVGVDVRNNFFVFVTAEGSVMKGELAQALRAEHFEIPSQIVATVEETCEVDPLTDREKWSYVLQAVVDMPLA